MTVWRSLRHPKPDITARVVADRSGWEIAQLQAHYGHELNSAVYFHDVRLVLAAGFQGIPGNVCLELVPRMESEPVSNERLGRLALQSLLDYRSEPAPSLRDYTPRDWETFKASGAKSVKAFNAATIAVSLRTHVGGIVLEAQPCVPGDSVFAAKAWAPISIEHSELGQRLRKLVVGANAMREAGVV